MSAAAEQWFAMTNEQRRDLCARIVPTLPKPGDEAGSILDCPNETGTWLAENMAEPIQTRAIEIIGDFLAGPRDQFANARLLREVMQLAGVCEDAIHNMQEAA